VLHAQSVVTALGISGALALACSGTSTGTGPSAGKPGGASGGTPTELDEDPQTQLPHALGTIVLGESHASDDTGKSAPLLSVQFVPDANLARACKSKLEGGCEIQKVANCAQDGGSASGCLPEEFCTLNEACNSVCKKYVTCEKACGRDEVCVASAGVGSVTQRGTCVKSETFDAGPLAFGGTTTPITLFPPYKYESKGSGAMFLGGSELRVQAQGATNAGFEKFDESFTATTFLQTTPALAKLSRQAVFGTGSVPIAWAPSNDSIVVTLSGTGGVAVCKAQDAAGRFDIPRAAIDAVLGDRKNGTTPAFGLSVARQRKEVRKGKKAKGSVNGISAQPEGWLELVTTSIESTSLQGCSDSRTICEEGCADLQNDEENCGACGSACNPQQNCSSGKCTCPNTQSTCGNACADLQRDPRNCGACAKSCSSQQECRAGKCGTAKEFCSQCFAAAEAGTCKNLLATCKADAACAKLYMCRNACTDATCSSKCDADNPTVGPKWNPYATCMRDACADMCR
jgi:hypothetical protein